MLKSLFNSQPNFHFSLSVCLSFCPSLISDIFFFFLCASLPLQILLCGFSVYFSATHSGRVSLTGREAWKPLTRQRVSQKLTSWSLAFSLTHILIPYSCISLVYGSTCSLLVVSYYKCLLRLNSDIAKPSPVFQHPRKSLS